VSSVELTFRPLVGHGGTHVLFEMSRLLDPARCQELIETSEDLAKKVLAADPQTSDGLASLGEAVGAKDAPLSVDSCVTEAETTVVYLRPEGDLRDWRLIEPIAWETAAGSHGPLIDAGHVLARGYSGNAPPALDLGDRKLKILVIRCSPDGYAYPRMDIERPWGELRRAWDGCAVRPDLKDVSGPGTLQQLRSLLQEDSNWDFVHIIAHGARHNETICLVDADGGEDHQQFSVLAGELQQIHDPRLFTLHVCHSSQLAIEVAFRHPRARVVSWLYEAPQEFQSEFFGHFYRHLFQPGPKLRVVHVEEAFRRTVRGLKQDTKKLGWFLPVLYGPANLVPLFDRSAELALQEILLRVRENDLDKARELALTCSSAENPRPVVRAEAARLLPNIDGLRAFDINFTELEREFGRVADGGDPDWGKLHRKWETRDFLRIPTGGVSVEADTLPLTVVDVLPCFAGLYDDWKALKQGVLAALEKLANFQRRIQDRVGEDLRELLDGCRELFQRRDRRSTLEVLSRRSFELGVRQLLAQARSVIPAHDANVGQDEAVEQVRRGLQLVADTKGILDEGAPELLDESTAQDLRREIGALVEFGARQLLARARSVIPAPNADIGPSQAVEQVGHALRLAMDASRIVDEGAPELLDEPIAQALRREVSGLVELGVGQLLARVARLFAPADANKAPHELAEHMCGALQLVIDARGILDEGAQDLLDEPAAERLRRGMDEQVDRARAAAARLQGGCGPPEGLLDPSRRFELCRWVLRPGEEPAAEAPALPSGDAPALLDFCRKAVQTAQEREAAVDFRSLPPERVPLLVNQAAPFLLATELAEPIDPYLCLAPLGAHPDSPAREISEDVEYRAGAEGGAEFRGVLLQAVAELTDPRKRLCLDARLLPCGDVKECTHRFHRIADLVFHGHPVPEEVFVGVGALDRAALLAVAGRTEEAASLGIEYAHQHLDDADALRAGCLLSVHHASVLPPDSEQLAPTLRGAMALLGILLGGPESLREWIGRRFAVYQQVVPPDLTEHVEAVSNGLKADVTSRLYRLEGQGGELRDLARALRQELHAELEGARVAATSARTFFKGQRGGYHAVRMTSGLEQPGHDLAATYRRLASLDDARFLQFVTATGMSVEVFHQLVFLFSDLRRAWVAPGDDVVPLIQHLLPERQDLEFAFDPPPGVAEALAAPDCCDRFPFHAALSPGAEATCALAAHAAIVAIESYYQQGKRLLAAEKLNRARLVIALDATLALDRYVGRLGYPLADKCLGSLSRLEELCTNWLRSVEKQVVTTWDSPDEAEGLRSLCEETLGLADHLSERYSFVRGDFRAAQGSLHRQCGVLGANRFRDGNAALRHLRKAYQCDPESAGIVINYLRACRMAHFQLPAGSQEAKQTLEEGIRAAEEFLRAPTTGDRAQVEQDLNELREVRDRASIGPASPDSFPPGLIEPEKMDD